MTEARDFDARPYSPDEARVAAFFAERGSGGGDDPIGAILAGYAWVVSERNTAREIGTMNMWLSGFIYGFAVCGIVMGITCLVLHGVLS